LYQSDYVRKNSSLNRIGSRNMLSGMRTGIPDEAHSQESDSVRSHFNVGMRTSHLISFNFPSRARRRHKRIPEVWKLWKEIFRPSELAHAIEKETQWTVWLGFLRLSSNLWIVSSSRRKLSSSPEPMISWRIWMSSLRSSIDFRRRIGLFIVRPTLTAREQNAHHVETFQIWFLSRYLSDDWRPQSLLLSVQKIFYTSLVVQTLIEVILGIFTHLFSVSLSIITVIYIQIHKSNDWIL